MPNEDNDTATHPDEDVALYPPHFNKNEMRSRGGDQLDSNTSYEAMIETICGAVDDSQPVEQYDGSLGVSRAFVDAQQRPVGQLQWDNNLASRYTNPGTVNNVRWCTGALITNNLFITAAHCFDSNPPGWVVPRINGTNDPISPQEIASTMHINFNYQVAPDGQPRLEKEYRIEELLEYRLGGLDIAIIRLAGNPGAEFGMGKLATSDPTVGDMMAIIGHPAGVPKRIEAGPVTQYDGDRIRYNSIDTLGGNSGSAIWHEASRQIVGIHTNGGCQRDGTGSNFGVRIDRIRAESPTVRRVEHLPLPLANGRYKVRQSSSGRFVDAHESSNEDFSVVSRTSQSNSTQDWQFTPVGLVCVAKQVSSGRFMDAHEGADNDFSVVTRTEQGNDTQKWVVMPSAGNLSTYTLQQLSSGRFLDAHVSSGEDFSVVTRTRQNNDTQLWHLAQLPDGAFTVSQKVNAQRLDAHQTDSNDFSVVTRTEQSDNTQQWEFTTVGAVYEIQQMSNQRYVDAHESEDNDFSVVTRETQSNDTQRWIATYLGGEEYTLQQLSSGRYLDAHESADNDFSLVTRPRQNNETQRWTIS